MDRYHCSNWDMKCVNTDIANKQSTEINNYFQSSQAYSKTHFLANFNQTLR